MGILLLLAIAEVAVITLRKRAQQRIVNEWLRGNLSMEELHLLKQTKWFRTIWKPTSKVVSSHKKND